MINVNMPKVDAAQTPKPGASVSAPAKSAKPDQVEQYQALHQAGQVPPAEQEVKKEIDEAELSQAVKQINDFVQDIQRDLEFSVDDDTGRTVIRVFDSKTDELIRQIPNEEVLELAKNLKETNGLLFNAKA